MRTHPVWITGVGAATPLGNDYKTIAANLLAGVSGVRTVDAFELKDHPAQIAGFIDPLPCPESFDAGWFASLETTERLAFWCAARALRDSGLWEKRTSLRVGLVLGCAGELPTAWERDMHSGGVRVFHPETIDTLCRRVTGNLDLTGPAIVMSAACASGNYALSIGRRWLELGWVDVCLAGAADMAVTPLNLAAFGNLRALSRRNDAPTKASRPFDKDRDGFVMGEGGALFVLERADRARRRGARAYAEIAGCGASSDAHHMVIPSPDPNPAIAAMRQAIGDAELSPSAVDYLNAHATSTPVGDIAEVNVLKTVFGADLPKMSVSSTKGMTGHLLTAAAAVEALACIVALETQTVPPTINLDNPDPECPLNHVANFAQQRRVRVTASNSFGFGGSNTCLILRAA
jgi:3-oxoacyl-[acyl-carrier-protein] synthase II